MLITWLRLEAGRRVLARLEFAMMLAVEEIGRGEVTLVCTIAAAGTRNQRSGVVGWREQGVTVAANLVSSDSSHAQHTAEHSTTNDSPCQPRPKRSAAGSTPNHRCRRVCCRWGTIVVILPDNKKRRFSCSRRPFFRYLPESRIPVYPTLASQPCHCYLEAISQSLNTSSQSLNTSSPLCLRQQPSPLRQNIPETFHR